MRRGKITLVYRALKCAAKVTTSLRDEENAPFVKDLGNDKALKRLAEILIHSSKLPASEIPHPKA
jgi:hypothetical protein